MSVKSRYNDCHTLLALFYKVNIKKASKIHDLGLDIIGRRIYKMTTHFLAACIAFSWWIKNSIASVFLFGEYPYPREEDYE